MNCLHCKCNLITRVIGLYLNRSDAPAQIIRIETPVRSGDILRICRLEEDRRYMEFTGHVAIKFIQFRVM